MGAKERARKMDVQRSFRLHTVSEEVVQRAIKKSKSSKCPDVYGISPFIFKLAPEVLAIPLTWTINKSIIEGKVPAAWKKARVLPLHKKGSKAAKENYRPVSILPCASKIAEEVVRSQLQGDFERNGILPNSQYGFRPQRSTILATAAVEHEWKRAKKKKLQCGSLFFDLSAAFDTLQAPLLVEKMKVYGVHSATTDWIFSYLTERQQCVDFNGFQSQVVEVKVGSPQGSVLSPLLFLIMVADLEEWLSEGSGLSYADDTSCYAIAKEESEVRRILEKSAEEILNFMQASHLAANPSKTNFLYFGGKKQKPLSVGGTMIEEGTEETLLGITFNKRLSWKNHMSNLKPQLLQRIGILRRLRMTLPAGVMCQMIDPVFTSKLRYALELVTNCDAESDSLLKELHALHRKAMKAALGYGMNDHPGDEYLLETTGQMSVQTLSRLATACMAWKSLRDPNKCSLMQGRLENHRSLKQTRQRCQRTFPPQDTNETLLSRLVEVWETIPRPIKEMNSPQAAKTALKCWVLSNQ